MTLDVNYPREGVRAHDFSTTDESSLITLVEQIKAETQLVTTEFLSNNNISAHVHAKNSAELIRNLEYNITLTDPPSSDITQIYDRGKKNSTTLALVVANIVDDVLRKYGSAFAVGYDMTNMSNMMNMDIMMMTNNATNGSGSALSRDSNTSKNMENDLALVNINDYETAKVLSSNIKDQFINQLRPRSLVNETTNLDKLENSLGKLEQAVNMKALPEAMMDLVHIQIHPMLQRVYDLELRQNIGAATSD
ncbi:MAG: hypothetical protein ACRD5E_00705 [Nitrososphaeraceae archaeon]